jgi:hypothetical protein
MFSWSAAVNRFLLDYPEGYSRPGGKLEPGFGEAMDCLADDYQRLALCIFPILQKPHGFSPGGQASFLR